MRRREARKRPAETGAATKAPAGGVFTTKTQRHEGQTTEGDRRILQELTEKTKVVPYRQQKTKDQGERSERRTRTAEG